MSHARTHVSQTHRRMLVCEWTCLAGLGLGCLFGLNASELHHTTATTTHASASVAGWLAGNRLFISKRRRAAIKLKPRGVNYIISASTICGSSKAAHCGGRAGHPKAAQQ